MNFSELTTLEIGGPIADFASAKTEQELINILKSLVENHKSYLVIGGGSNLLVSDEGFDGTVIKNETSGIKPDGQKLIVKSGTLLQELVDFSIEKGLGGLHKLNGIPGTVGGAIYGNAGAFGQTISDHLLQVACIDPVLTRPHPFPPPEGEGQGEGHPSKILKTLFKNDCKFEYRDSGFKRNGLIILEATFELPNRDPAVLKQEAEEVLEKRKKKYPPGTKCPGSFFKNLFISNLPEAVQKQIPPERDYFGKVPAWFFLDEVGAKGDQLGNIKIAQYHGNLFINQGNGKASDFYVLAKKYFDKVKEKYGIKLDPEVQLINLPPFN